MGTIAFISLSGAPLSASIQMEFWLTDLAGLFDLGVSGPSPPSVDFEDCDLAFFFGVVMADEIVMSLSWTTSFLILVIGVIEPVSSPSSIS
jgi:hypothetical protein